MDAVHAFDGFGADIFRKAIIVDGHVGVKVILGHAREPMLAAIHRTGAQEQHPAEGMRVACEVEEHAAITLEQGRAGRQAAVGTLRGGVEHGVETVEVEVLAHGVRIE